MKKVDYIGFKNRYLEEIKKEPNMPTLFVEKRKDVVVMMTDKKTYATIKEILSMHFDGAGWELKVNGGEDV